MINFDNPLRRLLDQLETARDYQARSLEALQRLVVAPGDVRGRMTVQEQIELTEALIASSDFAIAHARAHLLASGLDGVATETAQPLICTKPVRVVGMRSDGNEHALECWFRASNGNSPHYCQRESRGPNEMVIAIYRNGSTGQRSEPVIVRAGDWVLRHVLPAGPLCADGIVADSAVIKNSLSDDFFVLTHEECKASYDIDAIISPEEK